MAISSSALTLGQYAILSNEPLVQAVTFSLIDNGSVLARDIPFTNKATLVANGVRWEGNLPSVTWANLNEEPTVVNGTPTPYQEQAYIIRNSLETDKLFIQDQNQIVDPRASRLEAYLKAVAYDFNDKVINNTTVTNSKALVGFRSRIDNAATYGVRSENKINGGGVDLVGASATAATFASFLELVDQALWSADNPDGSGCTIYINDTLMRRWDRLARQFSGSGGFSQATDQLGRTVTMYKGAVIRDIGYKADQSTRIITNTETAAGLDGSSTFTSLYVVNYTSGHMGGWQFGPLAATDLGIDPTQGVTHRTLIDWAGGLLSQSTRSLSRIYNIKIS